MLIARIQRVHYGETHMGTGPFGGHRGDAYLADVDVFVDKITESEDGRTMPVRRYVGEWLSTEEPRDKDYFRICRWAIKTFGEELVAAELKQKRMEEDKKKFDALTEKAKKVVVTK